MAWQDVTSGHGGHEHCDQCLRTNWPVGADAGLAAEHGYWTEFKTLHIFS